MYAYWSYEMQTHRRTIGWMVVSALAMVTSISAAIPLAPNNDWWLIALSKLSLGTYGYIFSLGFWVSALTLAMALHLQLTLLGAVWRVERWRLHGLRWLLFGICAGLGIIGLFPDGGQFIGWHRFGAWLVIACATALTLGVRVWLPTYPSEFHRFSLVMAATAYGTALAYLLGFLRFTLLELLLLFLGGVWMTVFYAYLRVQTGVAPQAILEI